MGRERDCVPVEPNQSNVDFSGFLFLNPQFSLKAYLPYTLFCKLQEVSPEVKVLWYPAEEKMDSQQSFVYHLEVKVKRVLGFAAFSRPMFFFEV